MFTGIVEETGFVRSAHDNGDGRRLVVGAGVVLDDVSTGSSIAVDGCCLTVTEFGADDQGAWFAADAVPETLDRTTLGGSAEGDSVNLERPMRADGRFGGHIVQGHVDAVTELESVHEHVDGSRRLTFRLPGALAGQIVEKGSVALDGISLTVAAVEGATFDIAVVPHTLEVTTLGRRVVGDRLNVEVDVIARYVAGLMAADRLPNDRLTDAGGRI
ncbi:MAG: riboflavin synthase [Acidimicrobiales bacterium]|jgi:riboflavin synthase|nr:riboflavin synthase [Acidimicrobiales bacterium]MDP6649034.1 riboflavin synthase [Acidimicrobiales bacterium]MDP6760280.1 riboflavin synthase [Acidimicrobiales bacterium]|tara:strand:- start:1903 stop:2550 length:648 start_codon:yes stop_codon:yes gene_type:complete